MGHTTFSGFSAELIRFLEQLKVNNTREWFTEHKKTYQQVMKKPAEQFCEAISEQLETLTQQPHKAKIFRIHRDLRFSKDKTPYNTHLHISFTPQTQRSFTPAWFFGLEPGSLALGTGIFAFEKTALSQYREYVAGGGGDELQTIINKLEKGGLRIGRPDLKRVPSPFPQDHAHAELLKYKGVTTWLDFDSTGSAIGPSSVNHCMQGFKRLKPMFDWLASLH